MYRSKDIKIIHNKSHATYCKYLFGSTYLSRHHTSIAITERRNNQREKRIVFVVVLKLRGRRGGGGRRSNISKVNLVKLYKFACLSCAVYRFEGNTYILFYSILFYSILFYSILFYSILFYSILFYSILLHIFYSIIFYSKTPTKKRGPILSIRYMYTIVHFTV